MSGLRKYLHTTTRREKFLLFVFFCILLVFIYLQAFVKPLEDKIYGQELRQAPLLTKSYSEEEAEALAEKVKDRMGMYGPVTEADRQIEKEEKYILHIYLQVTLGRKRIFPLLEDLKEFDFLQGEKISREGEAYQLEVDLAFPLDFQKEYRETSPASPKKADEQGLGREKKPEEEEVKKQRPDPGKKQEAVGEEKKAKKEPPVKKPAAKKPQAKRAGSGEKKTRRKAEQAKPRLPEKEALLQTDLPRVLPPADQRPALSLVEEEEAYSLVKEEVRPRLENFQAYAGEETNPILKDLEEGYAFSYFYLGRGQNHYVFTFDPLPLKNLDIEIKSGRPGSLNFFCLGEEGVLEIYPYGRKEEMGDLPVQGLSYRPLPDQDTDILLFKVVP